MGGFGKFGVGEGYILCFMMVSKIVLGNIVCLSFSWLFDKASYIK